MQELERKQPSPAGAGAGRRSLEILVWQGSDAELLEAVRREHPNAPARLFDRVGRQINRTVLRMLGPDADHDDLVQEIFLVVWRELNKGKLREPAALSAWVGSTTVKLVYRELRARYVRRRLFILCDPVEPLIPACVQDLDARELLRLLYTLLGRLPPRERLLFSLRHLERRTLDDVARLCGCSLSSAKRRLAKAEQRYLALCRHFPEHPRLRDFAAASEEAP